MPEPGEDVLVEGEEEVQYVYVTLPKDVDSAQFGAGAVVRFEGLGTSKPQLHCSQGDTVLVGMYQDTVGSVLLIKEESGPAFNSKYTYSTIGHTDKQLRMAKVEQS